MFGSSTLWVSLYRNYILKLNQYVTFIIFIIIILGKCLSAAGKHHLLKPVDKNVVFIQQVNQH